MPCTARPSTNVGSSHPEELDEMDEDEDETSAPAVPPPMPQIPERFLNGRK